MTAIQPSPFQQHVLAVPQQFDLAALGGRGGGKTTAAELLALRHCEQFGPHARVLIVRRNFPDLATLEASLRMLLTMAYGTRASFNGAKHIWSLPNDATIFLRNLADENALATLQGQDFSLIIVDEVGTFPDPSLIDRLRSNLRAPAHVPVRMVLIGNPGGPGHHWVSRRYAFAQPWVPFVEETSGRTFVLCPSTYADNPALDQAAYRAQLDAATSTDQELRKAWIHGDWSAVGGCYFATVLSEKRSMIDSWPHLPSIDTRQLDQLLPAKRAAVEHASQWRVFISYDHGTAAPAVALVLAISPGAEGPDGRWYPRGSIVVLDELALHELQDLNKGLRLTIAETAACINGMCQRWGLKSRGCADDAIFSFFGNAGGSIADEFARAGVHFSPAYKGSRIAGFERLRVLMRDAGSPDLPGLYIASHCRYLWQTLPYLPRDLRNPEDVDTRSADHGLDALSYGVGWRVPEIKVGKLIGW